MKIFLFSFLLSLVPIQTSENRKQSENRRRFITSPHLET